jgi:hypothetical protein
MLPPPDEEQQVTYILFRASSDLGRFVYVALSTITIPEAKHS